MKEMAKKKFEEAKKRIRAKHEEFVKETEEALEGCEKRALDRAEKSRA